MDLGGTVFSKLAVYVVTTSTNTPFTIYGAETATGNYGPILERARYTSTIAYNSFTIATATSGGWVTFGDFPPVGFLKFVGAAVVSGGVSFIAVAT